MTHAIHTYLDSLQLGGPKHVRNVSVFPLLDRSDTGNNDYLTMDRALKEGTLKVTEIDTAGSVPELRVHNLAGKPILLLDGEELVGALQNRVLNITILVPPKTEMVVPASCVEMGRWSRRSARFQGGGRSMYARGRAEKMDQINHSLRASRSRRSDQRAVWRDIDRKAACMEVHCETSAMADIYRGTRDRLQAYRTLDCPTNARGAVFCVDGRPVGMEVVNSISTFEILFSKLLESYAMDALESKSSNPALPEEDAVRRLLEAASESNMETFPALGVGEDVRFESEKIVGGGLVVGDELVQLSAFTRNAGGHSLAKRRHYRGRFQDLQCSIDPKADETEASQLQTFLLDDEEV